MARAEPLPWGDDPRAAPAWRRGLVDLYLGLRLSAFGFSALLPLVGMAATVPGFDGAGMAWSLALALAFHAFAYVLNDVVDLWVDRTEPLRADSPLVRGIVSPRQALVVAWLQLPWAAGLLGAAGGGPGAFAWLALAFGAMTVYDLWGKRCRWPLLTDAVQSFGWCALLMVGAELAIDRTAVGPVRPAPALPWIVAYVFVCVLLVNGVHGALRDLANDHARGARTTATWFGARAAAGTGVALPRALSAYAALLQVTLVVCAGVAAGRLDHGSATAAWLIGGAVGSTLLVATVTLALAFGRTADRRALVAAGAVNIVATLLVLPLLVLARLGPVGSGVLMTSFIAPVIAMWAYNGSHWRLDRTTAEPPCRA